MAVFVLCLVLFLAMTGHSSAAYCMCKDGVADSALQKNIDYACGAGADCSPILQNGACYNPNTIRDHCNYAVNSYYQKKNQATGSCDFAGTAAPTQILTSTQNSACYPATPSAAGTSTSNTTSPSTGTPSTGTTPGTVTPTTGGTTTPTPPSSSSVFGIGPTAGTGTGITSTDNKASVTLHQNTHLLFWSFTLTLLFSGPIVFFRL